MKRNVTRGTVLVLAGMVVTLYAAGVQLYRALDRQLMADVANPAQAGPAALVEIRALDGGMLYRSPALGEGVIAAQEGFHQSDTSDRLLDRPP